MSKTRSIFLSLLSAALVFGGAQSAEAKGGGGGGRGGGGSFRGPPVSAPASRMPSIKPSIRGPSVGAKLPHRKYSFSRTRRHMPVNVGPRGEHPLIWYLNCKLNRLRLSHWTICRDYRQAEAARAAPANCAPTDARTGDWSDDKKPCPPKPSVGNPAGGPR